MKVLIVTVLAAICMPTVAATKCNPDRASSVQIMQDGRVYLRDSSDVRHLLGDLKVSPQSMALAQLAMSAIGKDVYISVAYADGVACDKPNNSQVLWLDVQYAKTGEQNL